MTKRYIVQKLKSTSVCGIERGVGCTWIHTSQQYGCGCRFEEETRTSVVLDQVGPGRQPEKRTKARLRKTCYRENWGRGGGNAVRRR